MKDISISVHFVQAVIKHAGARSCDIDRLLQQARISPRLINEEQARISARQFARLQAVTMRELNDEMLGYSAHPLKAGQWSALCHWLISCKNLGEALKRYCLFCEIIQGGLQPFLKTESNFMQLGFLPRNEDQGKLEPYAYELCMHAAHRLICWLTESFPPVEAITFDYPRPEHAREYHRMFPGINIEFESSVSGFVFNQKLLGLPVVQTLEGLGTFLRNPLYHILVNDYQSVNWSQRIKNILGKDLSRLPSFLEISRILEIQPRRLRRLLNKEGLTYSDLKLQLRRDIAIYHLSKQDTTVEEIAFKTGFSESSAFIRAFKKWTGVTPYTYRRDLV